MGSSVLLAAAAALFGEGPASPDQRAAGLALVGTMAAGMVVTLVMLRWVGKKEREKARVEKEAKD